MAVRTVRIQSRKALNAETAALTYFDEVKALLDQRLPQPTPPPSVDPPTEDEEIPLGLMEDAEAPPAPDWGPLQRYVAFQLRIARRRLLAAAHEREQEVHDDPDAREERDLAAREGYDRLVRTRQALRATVGENKALSILGVVGPTPLQPDALLERLQVAATRLHQAETREVEELLPGMSPDWNGLAAGLDEVAARLEAALDEVRMGKRVAFGALRRRERLHTEIRDLVVGFTRVLDGIYRIAGRRDLGERIRLPLPQSSPADETPEDPPVTDPAPPSEDPGPDPAPTPDPTPDPPEVLPIVAVVPDGEEVLR